MRAVQSTGGRCAIHTLEAIGYLPEWLRYSYRDNFQDFARRALTAENTVTVLLETTTSPPSISACL
jgi:hypothetical protein